ncbi:Receptor-like protein 12 [Dichanthelium oligosanthes]|uniref:Receptor-like protein 12 n=1 Tax=Dichanthelium oligosanthes TaxID=888268 RepID=A0A1E5WEY1_9POAL|nr:Receptor-like protein 12 [Dichanthelium oligosanthes]
MPWISGHRKPQPLLLLFLIHVVLGTQLSYTYSLGTYSNHQTAVPVPCRPDQASALLQLKSSFSTDGWGPFVAGSSPICTALASWQADTDCCGWEGVRCSDANGRVTTLDLGGCGFESGGLHPALFNLTSLRHLNLAWISFNGSQLPAIGFEQLTELTHINLSNCGFDGQIPDAIGQLTKLIPESFADLPSLTALGLTNNFLEGWLPSRIFQNKNLTTIDVSGTNFSGPIPSSIGNLKSLKNLGLAATGFSQELPSSIEQLQFLDCGLSGDVPSSIGNLENLYRLTLYNCNFSGKLPPQMFNLTQLEILYLDSNSFHGIMELSSFWKLRDLSYLSLSNNKFTVVAEDEGNSSGINQMGILLLELEAFYSLI